jgi:hypothetical protein
MQDVLLNQIWEDMKQTRTNVCYADLLIDKQNIRNKYFNITLAIFSTGGALMYFVSYYFPLIALIIIATISIVNEVSSFILMKNEDIAKLCNLRNKYVIYYNRLQELFNKLYFDKTSVEVAQRQFRSITDEYIDTQSEISRIFGKIDKKLGQIAADRSDEYLNKIYNEGK